MVIKTIESIPVVPFSVIVGGVAGVLGLIISLIGVIIALPFVGEFAGILTVGSLIVIPIVTFIGAFIVAAIFAILYNFLAPKVGGIQLQFKEPDNIPPPP